jgi:hypothetical protein
VAAGIDLHRIGVLRWCRQHPASLEVKWC